MSVSPEAMPSRLPKIRLVPAALAVLVQCAALVAVFASSWAIYLAAAVYFDADLSLLMPVPVLVPMLVLMQALAAALFSYLAGMASWWRWIHLCFPLAIWGMSCWHVPDEFYLTGFIVSLSLFWTTFRSQVPFYPSRPIVWQQVAGLMPQGKPVRMIDIGSGLGGMSMHIAKVRPDSRIEGIEIAPLPWMLSFVRAWIRRSSAVFRLGDYRKLDFASYDVIFAYLSPAAMLALWEKARQEMRPGSLLVSYEFEIPGVAPSLCVAADKQSPVIYVWRLS
ncbi:MAG: class I SAM-dependent methyltransferase [Methylotenera sp.]